MGVAAVGAAMGISGFVLRQAKRDDADEIAQGLPPGTCARGGAECDAITNDYEQADTFVGVGAAGFALLGAAGLGALIYAVVPGSDPPRRRADRTIEFTPILGSTIGFNLQGRF